MRLVEPSIRVFAGDGGGLRRAIVAGVDAGASVEQIECTLIEPAVVDEDEKAALWLLAWSWHEHGDAACRR